MLVIAYTASTKNDISTALRASEPEEIVPDVN
jgi:hypothetical protein